MKNMRAIPTLFTERIERMLANAQCEPFFQCYVRPLQKSFRINTHVIARDHFLRRANISGWTLTNVPWEENGFFIHRDDVSVPLGKTLEHFLGLFYIQEASSMAPARMLDAKAGSLVLDISSAPGSKTTQLSCLMGNTGLIVANDVSPTRTKATATNIERQGCSNVALTTIDAQRFASLSPNTFDRVLLDAPCSGEGTLSKTPEYFKRWSVHAIRKMAGLQKKLIVSAFAALKSGGTLVYSTCTFAPEENEEVVQHLLDTFPDSAVIEPLPDTFHWSEGLVSWEGKSLDDRLVHTRRLYPHLTGTGGFFLAKISKREATALSNTAHDFSSRSTEVILSAPQARSVTLFLEEQYGIPPYVWEDSIWTQIGHAVWSKPKAYLSLRSMIPIDRCGVKVGEDHEGRFKLSTTGARVLGRHIQRCRVLLDCPQAEDVRLGRDITLSFDQLSGIDAGSYAVLVTAEGDTLGVGLVQDGKIKNQIPRALI